MIFITEKRPDLRIYSPSKGVDIRFKNGRYETTDPAEIGVLERNRYVTNFTEDVERPLTEPSPLDNPLGSTESLPAFGPSWAQPAKPDEDEDEDDAGQPADH